MSAQNPQPNCESLPRPSLLERVQALSASIPAEQWDDLPKDLSRNYKHYLYGHPKAE